jgi:hypothetical protein
VDYSPWTHNQQPLSMGRASAACALPRRCRSPNTPNSGARGTLSGSPRRRSGNRSFLHVGCRTRTTELFGAETQGTCESIKRSGPRNPAARLTARLAFSSSARQTLTTCISVLYIPLQMASVRRLAAFRLDDDLHRGLQAVWLRDGIQPSEQVRRAVRAWLEKKGVIDKTAPRRAATRRRA